MPELVTFRAGNDPESLNSTKMTTKKCSIQSRPSNICEDEEEEDEEEKADKLTPCSSFPEILAMNKVVPSGDQLSLPAEAKINRRKRSHILSSSSFKHCSLNDNSIDSSMQHDIIEMEQHLERLKVQKRIEKRQPSVLRDLRANLAKNFSSKVLKPLPLEQARTLVDSERHYGQPAIPLRQKSPRRYNTKLTSLHKPSCD